MRERWKRMQCRGEPARTSRGRGAWLAAVLLAGLVTGAGAGETPVVGAFDAGPVGRTSATFNGELSAGLTADVTVWWGTNAAAWSYTNSVTVWTNVTPHRLSYAATGLDANTEYSYQFHATNAPYGDDVSAVKTFTTASDTGGFSGGAYDGYDQMADRHKLDFPQVRNAAVGATNVTIESAWLNGMLLSTGSVSISAVRVYYGQSDGVTNINAWDQNHTFFGVDELTPLTVQVDVDSGSTYFYRFYAIDTNDREGWASSSVEFLTPSAPAVTSAAAAPVGRASATLNGALSAGLTADITFHWGTDTNSWDHTNNIGLRDEGPLTLPVAGLDPGQTYSFQIAATNAYGADESDILEFTTASATGGFSGGAYDGFDHVTGDDLTAAAAGSLILLR